MLNALCEKKVYVTPDKLKWTSILLSCSNKKTKACLNILRKKGKKKNHYFLTEPTWSLGHA